MNQNCVAAKTPPWRPHCGPAPATGTVPSPPPPPPAGRTAASQRYSQHTDKFSLSFPWFCFSDEKRASSNENGLSKLNPNQGKKLEINFPYVICVFLFDAQTNGIAAVSSGLDRCSWWEGPAAWEAKWNLVRPSAGGRRSMADTLGWFSRGRSFQRVTQGPQGRAGLCLGSSSSPPRSLLPGPSRPLQVSLQVPPSLLQRASPGVSSRCALQVSPSRCASRCLPPGVPSSCPPGASPPGTPSRCSPSRRAPGVSLQVRPPGAPSRCASRSILQVCPSGALLQVHPPGVSSRCISACVLQVHPPGAPPGVSSPGVPPRNPAHGHSPTKDTTTERQHSHFSRSLSKSRWQKQVEGTRGGLQGAALTWTERMSLQGSAILASGPRLLQALRGCACEHPSAQPHQVAQGQARRLRVRNEKAAPTDQLPQFLPAGPRLVDGGGERPASLLHLV